MNEEVQQQDAAKQRKHQRAWDVILLVLNVVSILLLGWIVGDTLPYQAQLSLIVFGLSVFFQGLMLGQHAGIEAAKRIYSDIMGATQQMIIEVVQHNTQEKPERLGRYSTGEYGPEGLIGARAMTDIVQRGQAYVLNPDPDHIVLEGEGETDVLGETTTRYLLVIHRDHNSNERGNVQ